MITDQWCVALTQVGVPLQVFYNLGQLSVVLSSVLEGFRDALQHESLNTHGLKCRLMAWHQQLLIVHNMVVAPINSRMHALQGLQH